MKSDRNLLKEIFENFGFVEVEACEPTDKELKKFLKDHFITMKESGAVGACPEFRFTGTYSALKLMLKDFWGEEYAMKNYFKRIR